jgi:hypothetical protein
MTCLSSWSLCCLRWGEAKAAAWCLFDLFLERVVSIWSLFRTANTMRKRANWQADHGTSTPRCGLRGVVDVADVGSMQRRERRSDEVSSHDHMLAVAGLPHVCLGHLKTCPLTSLDSPCCM